MPCRYDESPEEKREEAKKLDVITHLACTYCKLLERQNMPIPAWATKWWEEHQKRDKERTHQEEIAARTESLRKRALAKLSAEERAALLAE